jgi:DNA-binding NtrC family response regulator
MTFGKGSSMKARVLIVDHDLASRGFLRECLEKEGHSVATLDSGLEVKPHLSKKTTNVIILNIETPGVREKDLLLQIKKTGPSRVLLVVSERGDPFLKEAIDLGVYGFIYKPFSIPEVCTLVDHLTR